MPYRVRAGRIERYRSGRLSKNWIFRRNFANAPCLGPHLARHILPFLEAYFDKGNSEINQKLRRRLHWLLM